MLDREIDNCRQTIALERFAISRYKEQIQKIPIVKLKMILSGVMTNEEAHEGQVLNLANTGGLVCSNGRHLSLYTR